MSKTLLFGTLVALLAACGDKGDSGTDAGADASCADQGDCPLLADVAFVEQGAPAGGHPVITDLVVFGDHLYLTTSANPLGSFGAAVFRTLDGQAYESVLVDATSQGFLRLRVIGDFLYIPDGDPNGYDPSYVYISADGLDFDKTVVIGSVHTFDVIGYTGDLLCSNGMESGAGSLCRTPDNGASPWEEVESTTFSRLKFMTEFQGKLFAAKRAVGAPHDYLVWNGDVDEHDGEPIEAVPGEANTWRWFVSASGRLFWSMASSEVGFAVYYTDDGDQWTPLAEVAGEFVSDFAELDGNLYLLSHTGLWGSTDETEFSYIAAAPDEETFGPLQVGQGVSVEAAASMTAFGGYLWCGSTHDGSLYRVE